jgi:hypothetical protein
MGICDFRIFPGGYNSGPPSIRRIEREEMGEKTERERKGREEQGKGLSHAFSFLEVGRSAFFLLTMLFPPPPFPSHF